MADKETYLGALFLVLSTTRGATKIITVGDEHHVLVNGEVVFVIPASVASTDSIKEVIRDVRS